MKETKTLAVFASVVVGSLLLGGCMGDSPSSGPSSVNTSARPSTGEASDTDPVASSGAVGSDTLAFTQWQLLEVDGAPLTVGLDPREKVAFTQAGEVLLLGCKGVVAGDFVVGADGEFEFQRAQSLADCGDVLSVSTLVRSTRVTGDIEEITFWADADPVAVFIQSPLD